MVQAEDGATQDTFVAKGAHYTLQIVGLKQIFGYSSGSSTRMLTLAPDTDYLRLCVMTHVTCQFLCQLCRKWSSTI